MGQRIIETDVSFFYSGLYRRFRNFTGSARARGFLPPIGNWLISASPCPKGSYLIIYIDCNLISAAVNRASKK